jgi:hypothetical protein
MPARIGDFRRKIALGLYELSGHAKEEMENDGFTIVDCKSAVYSGKVVATQRHGPGRTKQVIEGQALDGRSLHLICRLTESGKLRIITIFEVP